MTSSDALFALTDTEESATADSDERSPLAVRMRPRDADEILGQGHALAGGAPLRRLVDGERSGSVLLYGPPGTGKTTIARVLAANDSTHFLALSALSNGVKEIREGISRARLDRGRSTVLFIDEVHRFSKTQQDALLTAVEDGTVRLVAATTENPSFTVVAALLSRLTIVRLRPLPDDALRDLLRRAVDDTRGFGGRISLTSEAEDALVRLAGGDARSALNALEVSAAVADGQLVDIAAVEAGMSEAVPRYDRQGDEHHDVTSAFIKSLRGSDPDAALHYLARMLVAGEDPLFIARRLVIHATEDVGLADSQALQAAVAAAHAVQLLGMPECRLALAQATLHLAMAPKSNAVIRGVDKAISDVRKGGVYEVPSHLRYSRYAGATALGHGSGYRYPHAVPEGVLEQQYPPDVLRNTNYYEPTRHGQEDTLRSRLEALRRIVRPEE